jgi:hypothetical protein
MYFECIDIISVSDSDSAKLSSLNRGTETIIRFRLGLVVTPGLTPPVLTIGTGIVSRNVSHFSSTGLVVNELESIYCNYDRYFLVSY